jgi:hypothetical protein
MFVLVFFAGNSHVQSLLGLLIVTLSLAAQAYAMPFESSTLNTAEFVSLLCSCLTFYIGQFIYVDNTDISESGKSLVSWIALAVNVGFLIVMLVLMVLSRRDIKTVKKEVTRIRAETADMFDDVLKPAAGIDMDISHTTSTAKHQREQSVKNFDLEGIEMQEYKLDTVEEALSDDTPDPSVVAESSLPEGWAQLTADDGKSYYHHESMNTTQWDRPK